MVKATVNRTLWPRLLLAAGLIAALALGLGYRDRLSVEALQQWVEQAGVLGPLAYMGIYAVATVLFLPGSVLSIAGGALFGPALGTFVNLTGATDTAPTAVAAFAPRQGAVREILAVWRWF